MDDAKNLQISHSFWSGQHTFLDLIKSEFNSGRFRPLYCLWIVLAYTIHTPVLIYLFIAIIGFLCLIIWGKIILEIFSLSKEDDFSVYVYPLMFFVVIPFWNIFMFVSIQEKFVYFFCTFAIYQLIKAYQSIDLKRLFGALGLAILGLAGKETSLALIASFFAFAILDLCWSRIARGLSCWLAIMSGIILISYIVFISQVMGGYTASYKEQMTLDLLLNRLLNSSQAVKSFLIFAVTLIVSYFLFQRHKMFHVKAYFLIIPCFIIAFIFMLLPWNFYNYLISPLAPFFVAGGYLFFAFASRSNVWVKHVLQGLIVVVTVLNFFTVIIPYISKMGDKPKVVNIIKNIVQQNRQAKFFYPPPYAETADSLHLLSQGRIIYKDQINPNDLQDCKLSCYLLINDEANPIQVDSQITARRVYANGTWLMLQLLPHV